MPILQLSEWLGSSLQSYVHGFESRIGVVNTGTVKITVSYINDKKFVQTFENMPQEMLDYLTNYFSDWKNVTVICTELEGIGWVYHNPNIVASVTFDKNTFV